MSAEDLKKITLPSEALLPCICGEGDVRFHTYTKYEERGVIDAEVRTGFECSYCLAEAEAERPEDTRAWNNLQYLRIGRSAYHSGLTDEDKIADVIRDAKDWRAIAARVAHITNLAEKGEIFMVSAPKV